MAEPTSKEDYEQKYYSNLRYSGVGSEVTIHSPCPFCAEPDFMTWRVLDTEESMRHGGTCAHCKRGVRALVDRHANGVRLLMYQTEGPDPLPFIPQLPRLPTYQAQEKEWQSIKDELIEKWKKSGSDPDNAPSAYDVTSLQKTRMAARGEKFLEYDDIIAELRLNKT